MKSKGRVVNVRYEKCEVYVGRGSKWGNKFRIGIDGDRDEVIRKYEDWLLKNSRLMSELGELRGKVLGCWCKPKGCHGDVLLRLCEKEVSSRSRSTYSRSSPNDKVRCCDSSLGVRDGGRQYINVTAAARTARNYLPLPFIQPPSYHPCFCNAPPPPISVPSL